MAGTMHMVSCLSSASHSQLITCQEISGITMGRHHAWLHIILLLKVSDCTEIISHEIDSGISLKILGMSGGFEERNGFLRQMQKASTNRWKEINRDKRVSHRKIVLFFIIFFSQKISYALCSFNSFVTDLVTPIKTCQICASKVEHSFCQAVGLHNGRKTPWQSGDIHQNMLHLMLIRFWLKHYWRVAAAHCYNTSCPTICLFFSFSFNFPCFCPHFVVNSTNACLQPFNLCRSSIPQTWAAECIPSLTVFSWQHYAPVAPRDNGPPQRPQEHPPPPPLNSPSP